MSLEQLQSLQLTDDLVFVILRRMVDLGSVPAGENQYTLLSEGADYYSRLQLHESLVKPSFEQLSQEFEVYKQELIAAEQSRLAEVARVDALKARIAAFDPDPAIICQRMGLHISQPNPAIIFRDIIANNDTVLLGQMEAELAVYNLELAQKEQVDLMNQLRKNRDIALASTDFTQLADAPLSTEEKAQYRVYRSYLRSLPAIYEGGHQVEPIVYTFEQFTANPVNYPAGI